jgi:hypothetical protein
MMWELRELERFPLHFIVLKQTACHLTHEANVEQVFSTFPSGKSDPNMDRVPCSPGYGRGKQEVV